MKTNEKLVKYHLGNDQSNDAFMKEVDRIKQSGKRLTHNQKEKLMRIARPLVYGK